MCLDNGQLIVFLIVLPLGLMTSALVLFVWLLVRLRRRQEEREAVQC
jgi:hypothetical protein